MVIFGNRLFFKVPLFAIVNSVVPLLLAVNRSPLLRLFTLSAALLPIPPLTDNTAGVLLLFPTYTPLTGVEVRIVFPVPLGVRVRLLLFPVVIVPAFANPRDVAVTLMVSSVETELTAPLLITIPLIVLVAVAPVIAPDRESVDTPDTAPAVVIFTPFEVRAKVDEELPRLSALAVASVPILIAPVLVPPSVNGALSYV